MSSPSKSSNGTKTETSRPRLLIEDWLPATAIGVECIRERSTGQQPPDKRFHVWWARRPLTASRAAVLASLLPADFPRDVFERLLGLTGGSERVVQAQQLLDWARATGTRVPNPHGERAFKTPIREDDLKRAHSESESLWDGPPTLIDPMAGGGSIPLESIRLGWATLANEYNPVACSVLEATLDYPIRFGKRLGLRTRHWGAELRNRFNRRVQHLFPHVGRLPPHCYIFARTVPCPDTQNPTPLVPDWHLLRPKSGTAIVAEPIADKAKGTWRIRVREIGRGAGQLARPPKATYSSGKGTSLFTGTQIPADYIKAKAQAGEMGSALYAVAVKTPRGLTFQPPDETDLIALADAEQDLARLRPDWEKARIVPTEGRYQGDCDRSYVYGLTTWASLFTPRQLLCFGVLTEELRKLRVEIDTAEGTELGEAIVHVLSFVLDKFANWNAILSSWNPPAGTARSVFDRHDFSFKPTFCEMAPCGAGAGFDWAIDSTVGAYENLCALPRSPETQVPEISLGSADNLPELADGSVTAVVVDPPYADNVQYSELADFFYVWLKRTQGHRRPEWFSSYLCEHEQEAVVNVARHRQEPRASRRGRRDGSAAAAKVEANAFYQRLMTDVFRECRRILRDGSVLTVMFTHKKQEAWEALFASLIDAGFTITATWPVKTEGWHSLHQAKKNAAQSTVILVSRKRLPGAGVGYFDRTMQQAIRDTARSAAQRLEGQGLNPVDQLVGAFGPAMEVFSRFDAVRTDTGNPVAVGRAIDEAADAVSTWRVEQLSDRGLEGVEPEGRFALLCWDVLGAAEFRFNEAKLLGHAVGMDVDTLVAAGLVSMSGDKVKMLPARERRRDRPLEADETIDLLGDMVNTGRRRRKKDVLKIHPNDPHFRTAIDACHGLALRYLDAGSGTGGIGAARGLLKQQGWTKDSAVALRMESLVHAAPLGVRREKGKGSAAAEFPEFRAWHALLKPLFGVEPPDWSEKTALQLDLLSGLESDDHDQEAEEIEESSEED
jgi:putative DNA methylase